MRTNVVIDDELMDRTLQLTGLKTKRAAIDLALRTLLQIRAQEGILKLRGKIKWEGDLDAMRLD